MGFFDAIGKIAGGPGIAIGMSINALSSFGKAMVGYKANKDKNETDLILQSRKEVADQELEKTKYENSLTLEKIRKENELALAKVNSEKELSVEKEVTERERIKAKYMAEENSVKRAQIYLEAKKLGIPLSELEPWMKGSNWTNQ